MSCRCDSPGETPDPDAGRAISKPTTKQGLRLVIIDNITFEEKLLGMPHPPFEIKPDSSMVYSEFYIPAEKNFSSECLPPPALRQDIGASSALPNTS